MEDPEATRKWGSRPRRRILIFELSLMDVINDPLISLVNKADRVDHRSFCILLEGAAKACLQVRRCNDGE